MGGSGKKGEEREKIVGSEDGSEEGWTKEGREVRMDGGREKWREGRKEGGRRKGER